jgi:hypothetical protein
MEKFCFKSDCQKLFLWVMRLFQIPAMLQSRDEEQTLREASECETEGGFCNKSHITSAISQGSIHACRTYSYGPIPKGRHLTDGHTPNSQGLLKTRAGLLS